MKSNTKVFKIVLTASLIALSTVLSLITIFQMPLDGKVTLLSLLPVAMISIEYGVKWGLVSSFVYSIIQLFLSLGAVLSWGLTPLILIASILLDYILAFTSIGLAGVFRTKGLKGICAGIFMSMCLRFLCHLISGVFLFSEFCPDSWNVVLYSVCYNGAFMLPEMIFTMIGAVLLFRLPQINKLMRGDQLTVAQSKNK